MPADDSAAPHIRIFNDAEEVAHAAASRFVDVARQSLASEGLFSVALAGGSTPERVYELLAGEEFSGSIQWSNVHIFFGDERAVPPDDRQSNYRMANETMLSRLSIPARNIHRMRGEGDAAANAGLYEDEMRAFFGDVEWPRFDLVLLGMGEDGHTASLFPGSDALGETRAWVVANWVEKLNAWRVTLTAPVINHAAHVLFMATGTAKAERIAEVIEGAREPERLPAQLIRPVDGSLEWFVDRNAARKL